MNKCIEHPGRRTPGGYGKVFLGGREYAAHRLVWIAANGPIPKGMQVLHRCDNPPCVNSDHLFLGTHADNMRDMAAKGRRRGGGDGSYQSGKTHCLRGHEFTPENTYIHGGRHCRACRKERYETTYRERYKERKREYDRERWRRLHP